MMTAESLIADLRGRGVELWTEGDKLKFKAPVGALDDALRESVGLHRAEIVAMLSAPIGPQEKPWDWLDHIPPDDARYLATKPKQESCPWCKRRAGHTSDCNDMHNGWSAMIPFGKHRGKTVVEVDKIDREYLRWMKSKSDLSGELQAEIERVLNPVH